MINFNVTELIDYIKILTSNDYVLNNISVEGEVSNLNLHSNGNAYFSLKDDFSKINIIIYNHTEIENILEVKTGSLVLVEGSLNVLESDGSFRIIGTSIKNIGIGNLYEEFLKTKEELEKKGMFLDKHKKAIPNFPKKIGIITSIDGAAIKDIYNVSDRRNPYINIEHFPSLVQGNYAVNSLLRGLDYFDKSDVDLVIIGRGGGSYEDLNAFNSKDLALRIFNFSKPIISAVGHEHDYFISDFVSDLRAPTPSAAAELSFFNHDDFLYRFRQDILKIEEKVSLNIGNEKKHLSLLKKRLDLLSFDKIIKNKKNDLNDIMTNITNIANKKLVNCRNELNIYNIKLDIKNLNSKLEIEKRKLKNDYDILNSLYMKSISVENIKLIRIKNRLDNLDIKSILKKGYLVAIDDENSLIKNIDSVNVDDNLNLIMFNGSIKTKVIEKRSN